MRERAWRAWPKCSRMGRVEASMNDVLLSFRRTKEVVATQSGNGYQEATAPGQHRRLVDFKRARWPKEL